ncbi:hypothetical protein COO60DRAFT_640015 [Scenedesmus sp. NREL 46B-D3]|nr:hypothetical protein COO60DRAFT_640015 [Scenedesmus sp. NREL 46B-D3]
MLQIVLSSVSCVCCAVLVHVMRAQPVNCGVHVLRALFCIGRTCHWLPASGQHCKSRHSMEPLSTLHYTNRSYIMCFVILATVEQQSCTAAKQVHLPGCW